MTGLQFRCARHGFESLASDPGGLLGGFDGRDRRELHVYAVDPGPEQMLVSMHEQLHHELHWSTLWGLTAAMAGLLAEEGVDPERLNDVATVMNASCRQVHEVFATTISSGVIGLEAAGRLLRGNERYLSYLAQGLGVGGDNRWPWQFRESAAQSLLRCLMQPQHLVSAAARGFEGVRLRDVVIADQVLPDQVLAQVAAEAGAWWNDTFEDLVGEFPDRGGDLGGPDGRGLPESAAEMERLKAWEEQVLIPRLQDIARTKLLARDLPIADEQDYLQAVDALVMSFQALGPDDWAIEMLTDRRGLLQEPLGAEREAIQLHTRPARAQIFDADELGEHSPVFLHPPGEGKRVMATYLPRRTYQRQFVGFEDFPDGPPVLALVGPARLEEDDGPTSAGQEPPRTPGDLNRVAPMVLIRPDISPADLGQMFTSLPMLTITSLRTTAEEVPQQHVLALDHAVVLLDLPLSVQVRAWVEGPWTVRYRVIGLEGDRPLNMVVYGLDELPNLTFVAFRSDVGLGEVVQLSDRFPQSLHQDLQLDDERLEEVMAATSWMFAAWWRIEEHS